MGCSGKLVTLYEKHMLPSPDWPEGKNMLMTGEVVGTLDNYKGSYQYPFLDSYLWHRNGSNIRMFGVKTEDEVRLTLHDDTGNNKPVIFTLAAEGEGEQKQCSASCGEKTFSRPCESYHDGEKFVWYVLEQTNNHMAVYRVGSRQPEAFINNVDVDESINFNHYRTYNPSSKQFSTWDFQGVNLSTDDLPEEIQVNPFVEVGLKRIIKGHLKHLRFKWHCEWAREREGGGEGGM
ncbi:hypothetical protein Pmani_027644 [Petrolisthes manimaculis]|uniref:Uncharacterized protein n=1 Tax=Petrolisthes manimaculis TaxID=1843537 RepID=A0AAE1P2J6_9EUCA|nr:hypothetical protein Pmani_027644 [Petrolisthes manimaculis]